MEHERSHAIVSREMKVVRQMSRSIAESCDRFDSCRVSGLGTLFAQRDPGFHGDTDGDTQRTEPTSRGGQRTERSPGLRRA